MVFEMARAEEVLAKGLKSLRVGLKDIRSHKAVDPVKEMLIWPLNIKTTRTNAWIGVGLHAGRTTAVTRATLNTRLGTTHAHQVARQIFLEFPD